MSNAFAKESRPTIVGMLKSSKIADLLKEIELVYAEGVDAFGLQIEMLDVSERNAENYKKLFAAMKGKPAYVTNYIRCNALTELTDEELVDELILAVECGAKLIDLRSDTFDRQPTEHTTNPEAVKKQIEVIKRIKSMGAEVLMSAHVLKFIEKNEVLKIALDQQERGADIAKIVVEANSEEELCEVFETSLLLKKELKIPALFLCNGTHNLKHRTFGPVLSDGLFLAVENSNEHPAQPTIEKVKTILSLAGYKDLP